MDTPSTQGAPWIPSPAGERLSVFSDDSAECACELWQMELLSPIRTSGESIKLDQQMWECGIGQCGCGCGRTGGGGLGRSGA